MPRWLAFLWYEFAYWVGLAFMMVAFSLRLSGRKNIPRTGPVLIIANHESFFDPVLVGLAAPRPLHSLARKTLFVGSFGTLIRSLGAIELDVESIGIDGLKRIVRLLQNGEGVVVYPEGTRSDTGEMGPLKPGVQLLIKRAKCPVVPVGVAGAFEALPWWSKTPILSPLFWPAGPSTMAVCVGKPLDGERLAKLSRDELVQELTRELHAVVVKAEKMRRKV
jgi:1-acyl-sn-glycerol-3-phosphate acyltransferase